MSSGPPRSFCVSRRNNELARKFKWQNTVMMGFVGEEIFKISKDVIENAAFFLPKNTFASGEKFVGAYH